MSYIDYDVIDLEMACRRRQVVLSAIVPLGIWDPWHTKTQLIQMFKDLWGVHGKSYHSVGKSYENRDIWMFELGNPRGQAILWDGALHGTEDRGTEIILMIAKWLLESGDPKADWILKNCHVLFIPVVNRDSEYPRFKRANQNHTDCQWGVDLNRNFGTGWRSASCTSSENYSGPSAASEKETQTMRAVFQQYRPVFYTNLHCGAGPYAGAYRDCDSGIRNEVKSKMDAAAAELGISPFSVNTMGSTGFAIGDGYTVGGAHSWLVEIMQGDCWRHDDALWRDVVNIHFPRCLALFIGQCMTMERAPEDGTPMRSGINVTSLFYHYEPTYTPNSVLHRDFAFFQGQGINIISLTLVWAYSEPSIGNYRESYYDDLIRVASIAAIYGISVVIDFHTLMHDDSFTVPTWVPGRKFTAVFTTPWVRAAWLAHLEYSASRLAGISNLHSFHMMNEPWGGGSVDEWIQLWTDMRQVFKAQSSKPVSIRFATETVQRNFDTDPRIFDICDYMTFNWYPGYATKAQLEALVSESKARGKEIMIGEYGMETASDAGQADSYRQQLEWYRSLGIDATLAWHWRADYQTSDPRTWNPDKIGESWIIAKNIEGDPRPAFYVVAEYNEPTPISPFNLTAALAAGGLTFAATGNPLYAGVAAIIGGLITKKT